MQINRSISVLLVSLTLMATAVQAQSLSDSLKGWWTFTSNALDSSGNGNDGVVYGATLTKDRFDHINRAYHFDGSSYINFGSDASLKPVDHSVVFWFKYSDSSKIQVMLGNSNSLNGEWGVNCWYVAGYGLRYNMGAGANDHVSFVENPKSFADGQWHMYAITYSETTDKMSMYIDGKFYSNQNGTGTKGGVGASENVQFYTNEPWIAGASSQYFTSTPNSGPNYFTGDLDDIRIYSRAISASEVQELYGMTSSVETVNYSFPLDIFPNPTTGLVNINFTENQDLNGSQLSIFNSVGQKLHVEQIISAKAKIDLNAYGNEGFYMLKLTDPQGVSRLAKILVVR